MGAQGAGGRIKQWFECEGLGCIQFVQDRVDGRQLLKMDSAP
jgi:hypothetical protein